MRGSGEEVTQEAGALEDVLPRRFGRATGDYQLLELQDAQGVARYALLVKAGAGGSLGVG
jgi:hypothetical protein